tara:strand:- start:5472 stop:5828 length:357 start_codon:yes stop_codon:yes gene_type:complete
MPKQRREYTRLNPATGRRVKATGVLGRSIWKKAKNKNAKEKKKTNKKDTKKDVKKKNPVLVLKTTNGNVRPSAKSFVQMMGGTRKAVDKTIKLNGDYFKCFRYRAEDGTYHHRMYKVS